mgnify:CR=1 FL=1
MSDLSQRLTELEKRLEALESSIAILTTRISCSNGEVYVTGPLNVSIADTFPSASLPQDCPIRS